MSLIKNITNVDKAVRRDAKYYRSQSKYVIVSTDKSKQVVSRWATNWCHMALLYRVIASFYGTVVSNTERAKSVLFNNIISKPELLYDYSTALTIGEVPQNESYQSICDKVTATFQTVLNILPKDDDDDEEEGAIKIKINLKETPKDRIEGIQGYVREVLELKETKVKEIQVLKEKMNNPHLTLEARTRACIELSNMLKEKWEIEGFKIYDDAFIEKTNNEIRVVLRAIAQETSNALRSANQRHMTFDQLAAEYQRLSDTIVDLRPVLDKFEIARDQLDLLLTQLHERLAFPFERILKERQSKLESELKGFQEVHGQYELVAKTAQDIESGMRALAASLQPSNSSLARFDFAYLRQQLSSRRLNLEQRAKDNQSKLEMNAKAQFKYAKLNIKDLKEALIFLLDKKSLVLIQQAQGSDAEQREKIGKELQQVLNALSDLRKPSFDKGFEKFIPLTQFSTQPFVSVEVQKINNNIRTVNSFDNLFQLEREAQQLKQERAEIEKEGMVLSGLQDTLETLYQKSLQTRGESDKFRELLERERQLAQELAQVGNDIASWSVLVTAESYVAKLKEFNSRYNQGQALPSY